MIITVKRVFAICVVATAIATGVLVGAGILSTRDNKTTGADDQYQLVVETSGSMNTAPVDAVNAARAYFGRMATKPSAPHIPIDIGRVIATTKKDLPSLVPGITEIGGDVDLSARVWVIEAGGPFVFEHDPAYGGTRTATHGFLLVDDADGSLLGIQVDNSERAK